jgi:1-acyl-sn-glycerol-3-phosphate acyltransferase
MYRWLRRNLHRQCSGENGHNEQNGSPFVSALAGLSALVLESVLGILRSLAVFLWMAVSVIPAATALLILSLFVDSKKLWWWIANPWLKGAIAATRLIGDIDYRVQGQENLPSADDNQRIILCAKHQSTWETFFFPSMMPHPLAYVFKRELLLIPFFGWALARLEMVHIDRSARSEAWNKVATLGAKLMDQGKWVIMFPEGTRTVRGGQGGYKTGASRLALLTGAKIVPIAVASGRCWPRATWTFLPGTIDVSIGEPIIADEGEDAAQLMRRVEAWIEGEMRRIDPEAYTMDDALSSTEIATKQKQTPG